MLALVLRSRVRHANMQNAHGTSIQIDCHSNDFLSFSCKVAVWPGKYACKKLKCFQIN